MDPSSSHPRASSRWWQAGFGATLAVAMAMATFMQSAIGTLAPFLTADLEVSRSQIGALTTALFLVGGAASVPAGQVADALGPRRLTLALFALAAATTVAAGLSPTYPWLVGAAALGGLAMATGNPATNKLLAAYVPEGRQGVLTGVKQSGVQAGAFVAGAALPPLALLVGWRGALLVVTAVAVAGTLATVLVVPRDGPPDRGGVPPIKDIRGPLVARLSFYAFLMGAGVAVASAYLPLYANEQLGFSESLAGLSWATVGAFGLIARVVWGQQSDQVRDFSTPLVAVAGLAVVAQALIWGAQAVGAWMLWVGVAAFGMSAASWSSVGMLAIVKRMDAGDAGRSSSVVSIAYYAGFVASPVAFGYSVDITDGYDLGWGVITVGFAIATLAAWRWRREG